MAKDIYEKANDPNVRGVACFNGPYHFGGAQQREGPAKIKFKWDMYNTE
jgi:hypothetical protein